ncbi:DUF2922 family protein [Clostridium tarantellae]|uniref:DUF2922 family protein n=2 Tax=Clostridium tarantellae TaxID=39493 RepID=A0A6I1MTJ9_9CLOT|nr:DUF2922 family protein [Clostridium tarantellae]
MVFKDEKNENISLSIRNINDITNEQVNGCMDTILEKNIFESKDGMNLVSKVSARIVHTTTTPYEFQ